MKTKTPELDKMSAVQPKSQAIGEFIEWLHEQHIHLAKYHEHDEYCRNEDGRISCGLFSSNKHPALYQHDERIESLLARFFEIDLEKVEKEKLAVLDELRRGP